MSQSVSISIATNSVITAAKFFGWLVTGSPTLFAETIHSAADVGNQVLLKVGEVRGRGEPDAEHPFGRGQEQFFWALVSAVSIFFVGCGVTVYHGVHALMTAHAVEPFTKLAVGLLVFSLALELYTLRVAWKEMGGLAGIKEGWENTTVLAVLLEDGVAVLGILLTLLVAGISTVFGPQPVIDAIVSILVGVILGAMAIFLASINRKVLIDVADHGVNRAVVDFLAEQGVVTKASSLMVGVDRFVVFVRAHAVPQWDESSHPRILGEKVKRHLQERLGKTVIAVYWKLPFTEKL